MYYFSHSATISYHNQSSIVFGDPSANFKNDYKKEETKPTDFSKKRVVT